MTAEKVVDYVIEFVNQLQRVFHYDVTEDESQELIMHALGLKFPVEIENEEMNAKLWLFGMLSVYYHDIRYNNSIRGIENSIAKSSNTDLDGDLLEKPKTDHSYSIALCNHYSVNPSEIPNVISAEYIKHEGKLENDMQENGDASKDTNENMYHRAIKSLNQSAKNTRNYMGGSDIQKSGVLYEQKTGRIMGDMEFIR